MNDDGTRSSSSSTASSSSSQSPRLEIFGVRKGSKEPSRQSVAFISAQRLVPPGTVVHYHDNQLDGTETISSSSDQFGSGGTTSHHRRHSPAEPRSSPPTVTDIAQKPSSPVVSSHSVSNRDRTSKTKPILTDQQSLCRRRPDQHRPPPSAGTHNAESDTTSTTRQSVSDSKLHEPTDLKGSHSEARTRANDRPEKLQPDENEPDTRVEDLDRRSVIAQGEGLGSTSTSRSTTEGTVDTIDSIKDVSTQLDQTKGRESTTVIGTQQSGVQRETKQSEDQADDDIAKQPDSNNRNGHNRLSGSQGVITDTPTTTIVITSPDTSTSRPTNLESSLHVTEAADRQFQQSLQQYRELQQPYQSTIANTDNVTNEQHLDTGRVIASLSPAITSASTSSASSTQPYGVAPPPGGPESPDVNALGSGMNKGPDLAVGSSQSIRGYGQAQESYDQDRRYNEGERAGNQQPVSYSGPAHNQSSQSIARGDYESSNFQRYPVGDRDPLQQPRGISSEPLKTKIQPKGRGKRKAEQVVQAEVQTGGIPNPSYPPPQRDAAGLAISTDLGPGRNMEVQINHDYVAGNAPPTYDDYAYPANGLPSSVSYNPGQGFSSPSGQAPLYPPPPNGANHLSQPSYSAIGPSGQSMEPVSPAQRPPDRVPGGPTYNAMAGPSNPYLQGLPPAIQSQMPGGADYPSLPIGVSGGKIFKCMGFPGCEMTFTRSEHLARHVRKHTGERPFPCHCGKAFSRLDNLRQHAATVHNDSTDLNDRMLRALAPVHAALSQRAGKEQRQRGEVLSVPKTAAERAKSVQPKKPKRIPRGIPGEGGPVHMQLMQMPHHFGPDMPPPPPVMIPGQPGFHLQHPISSSITSDPDMGPQYPTHMVPPPMGGPVHGIPVGPAHGHQPHPPPWFPPHAGETDSSYRPGTDGRPGTGYASQHTSAGVSPLLPHPSQPPPLSGYGQYGRSSHEHRPPTGFQYEPFPHGIRPGSKHPVSLQLQHPPRSAGPAMSGHSAPPLDNRFSERPGTANSPYLQIPSLMSAPPYAPSYAQAQPPSASTQTSFSPHTVRPPFQGDMYHHPPGTAPSTGRPGTGILQQQQYSHPMPLHSGPYQSSHGSSGNSSRLTGNSSQHSMGHVTHQQIQEIYGNSGATQESPFSYHPPPTATQPPPPAQYTFGTGMPGYALQPQGYQPDMEGRKRKTEELEPDAYDVDRRKGQKTDLGKVATGVFYPGRVERRNSLAISSLITGDGQSQVEGPQDPADTEAEYGNGYYQDNGEPILSDQNNMANFTFGSVPGPEYGYGGNGHPSYMVEEQQQPHTMNVKPGHHAMDVKARALLDNGGYDV